MARDSVRVRLRHQIPGYSVGEIVSFSPTIAARLVDELYAEYYEPPAAETSSEQSEEEGTKAARRRVRRQMSADGGGTRYLTK